MARTKITIEQNMMSRLISRGMFDNQAEEVMAIVKDHDSMEDMKGRWDDDIEGYHPALWPVLWHSVKRCAAEYIKENCPDAWFRANF